MNNEVNVPEGVQRYYVHLVRGSEPAIDVVPHANGAWIKAADVDLIRSQECQRVREALFSELEAAGWSSGEEIPTDEVEAAFARIIEQAEDPEQPALSTDSPCKANASSVSDQSPALSEGVGSFGGTRPKDAARERLEESIRVALGAGHYPETVQGVVERVLEEAPK